MRIEAVQPICEACPKPLSGRWTRHVPVAVAYRGRMLCPTCALDAIHVDGLTLDEAIGCRR